MSRDGCALESSRSTGPARGAGAKSDFAFARPVGECMTSKRSLA